MSQEHSITPSEEVVDGWESEWHHYNGKYTYEMFMAKQAARWGADQELEACCEWLLDNGYALLSPEMRKDRRPKQPSLKQQALDALDYSLELEVNGERYDIIRRALESLPE
jgi:hypothetical protein